MNLIGNFRGKAGNWRYVLVFGAVYTISQAVIGGILHPLGAGKTLMAQTSLSGEAVRGILGGWKDANMLDFYARHFYFDFPHPVWYGLFLASAMAMALNRNGIPGRFNYLLAFPFLAGACDLIENMFHVAFINNFDYIVQPWVALSGIVSIAKWVLAGFSVMLICLLAARYIMLGGDINNETREF